MVQWIVSVGARQADFERALGAEMCDGGDERRAVTVSSSQQAEDAAFRAAESGATRVVAVGGDGTVNAVLNGLARSQRTCELGVVPAGTANDFARAVELEGLPLADTVRAAAGALGLPVDVGTVNGRRFANMLTLGFAARLSESVPRPLKDALGGIAYPLHGIRAIAEWDPISVHIVSDAGVWQGEALGVCVCNGRSAGGGMPVAPTAKLNDGLLDILVIPAAGVPQLMSQFVSRWMGGTEQVSGLVTWRTSQVVVASAAPIAGSLDGAVSQAAQWNVGVVPGAVRLALPAIPQTLMP